MNQHGVFYKTERLYHCQPVNFKTDCGGQVPQKISVTKQYRHAYIGFLHVYGRWFITKLLNFLQHNLAF
jgi:hypothetical protein